MWTASRVVIHRVTGFEQIAAHTHGLGPKVWIFYDGNYGQLSTFYYRLEDPRFAGGVVRSSKSLYRGSSRFMCTRT